MSIIPRLNLIKIVEGGNKDIMIWKKYHTSFDNVIRCNKCSEQIHNVEYVAETFGVKVPQILFSISEMELHNIKFHKGSYSYYNSNLPYYLQRNVKFLDKFLDVYLFFEQYKDYAYVFYFTIGLIIGTFL